MSCQVPVINDQTLCIIAGCFKLVEQWNAMDLFVNFQITEHSVHTVPGNAACTVFVNNAFCPEVLI
jgi:hypothetical protein